jgi:1-deoxy-D-xylulose-5-phosphate synthase
VGEDGATHHGSFDLAFLVSIPNMIISAPMNEEELRNLMFTAQESNHGPFSIRYPKGAGVMEHWRTEFKTLEIGKGRKLRDGKDLAILSIGHPGNYAADAIIEAEKLGISVAHYDMRFLKPLDENLLHEVFATHKKVITVEDGTIIGGLGSAVLGFMSEHNYNAKVVRLGIPDRFIEHGSNSILHRESGYDAKGILRSIRSIMKVQ